MNILLKYILSLSASGSLLILLLLLTKPLYRNRIEKRWQYYLWLIVLARLLLPFSLETSLMSTLFSEEVPSVFVSEPAGNTVLFPESDGFPSAQDELILPEYGSHTDDSYDHSPFSFEKLFSYLWLIWLFAALGLLLRKITIYQGFTRYVKAGCTEVSDPTLLNRLAQLGESIGVTRPVELYVNPLLSSPLLIGFFQPCIVLSSAELSASDFQYTVLHELTHCKRRDMFYKWFVQFTICVHWFNPLVYLMEREIRRDCELSCDEAVISALSPQERRAYGDTLLNAAGAKGSYQNSLASITLHESAEQLKERLCAIMSYHKKPKWAAVISVLLAVLTVTGGLAAGAYAPPVYTPRNASADTENRGIIGSETNTDLPAYPVKDGASGGLTGESYRFTRNGYYQAPYLFEIGYNLPTSRKEDYSYKTLTVSGKPMPVYYPDSCRSAMQDSKVSQSLTVLLSRIQSENAETDFPLVCPLVYSIETIGNKSPAELAEQYYSEASLTGFDAVFGLLEQNAQAVWLNRLFDDGSIAFFSIALQNLPQDNPLVSTMQKRAYAEDDIAFFSVACQNASASGLEAWLSRAKQDGRTAFQVSLMKSLGKDGELDAFQDALDQKRIEEYRVHGVTQKEGAYYYQSQRVRILLDQRADDLSCVYLQTYPRGTVDIKILRDTSNNIQSVSLMSEAESRELFSDWYDESSKDEWKNEWKDEWENDEDWDWDEEALQLSYQRIVKEDAPQPVQTALQACKANTWYFLRAGEWQWQYLYYSGLPRNYAWEIAEDDDRLQFNIRDIGDSHAGYVLLCFYTDTSTPVVSYQGKQITPVEVTVQMPMANVPVYTPDATKTITIPVSIPTIAANKSVCIAAIPNVTNANGKRWTYSLTAKDARSLFVGMAYDGSRTGKAGTWYNYCGNENNAQAQSPSTRLDSSGTSFGSNTSSGDTFYLYVGSTGLALENITGTITIQYK